MLSRYLRSFLAATVICFLILGCKPDVQPNVLIIMIDDLRPELKSFGADYIHSPNIDRLAKSGVSFLNHYVNAPSCGPSRYTFLMGKYGPPGNDAIFQRSKAIAEGKVVDPSMPEWFKSHGYITLSIGKVSHHPGGLGGERWNNPAQLEMPKAWDKSLMPVGEWDDPRGSMHGLAFGEKRKISSEMDVFQSVEAEDKDFPDGLILDTALAELSSLATSDKPFFMAVGLLKPHLPFGSPEKYMRFYEGKELPPIPHPNIPTEQSTWHRSGEFHQYNTWEKDPNIDPDFADEVRRHYAAAVSYSDAQVGKILDLLERSGLDENTIVVLWGDHGWHLGEHGIWGKHSLFEESLKSPLIITYPNMEVNGVKTEAMVETSDIFPTLCDISGLEKPEFLDGVSMMAHLKDISSKGHAVVGYKQGASTLRTQTHRLILHDDGFVELYDHRSPEKETRNVANERPILVDSLTRVLQEKAIKWKNISF